jgi:hypothetical protein
MQRLVGLTVHIPYKPPNAARAWTADRPVVLGDGFLVYCAADDGSRTTRSARQTACHRTRAAPPHGELRRTETAGQAADGPPPDLIDTEEVTGSIPVSPTTSSQFVGRFPYIGAGLEIIFPQVFRELRRVSAADRVPERHVSYLVNGALASAQHHAGGVVTIHWRYSGGTETSSCEVKAVAAMADGRRRVAVDLAGQRGRRASATSCHDGRRQARDARSIAPGAGG